ncbi:RNA helicase [Ectothiorhodospira haloalkaliphila]|uniref:ATP-dependent RNA helicase DeaD n=1 Tax=Ectothiorhodospira haloalkaliphila TaxID=421628 RepID=W8KK92_9GAMM|nr:MULTISPECIES: DEAD/DEAH box helicase [Ectothiorhodospira]AHK79573.1 RNA helicase [Ectothiorhodospira haloalkaliphila]MCG5493032.1 DEAD/DEAH box helicase [Ectothiorhodospira variabilis]MCG5497247.1 DEAD/DEAH box helicase [Ectothiorhodospira variabilis]MCG5502361.1 DEAD/DEAH box helicase [Ectothiorhodospira variabilis]MCG5505873.1 DEAD/DEAH box helicase [Ectothiorhodospira variabilis]
MNQENLTPAAFAALGLPASILKSLDESGYEEPTPIQAQSIPVLLSGQDLLGQAQTGTGKTAAFALPLLAKLNPNVQYPQILVLAPTRELAIQVAEAFETYARHMPDFHVLPIYGGQSYTVQLRQLKRGAQVIVGTPGRVMDHMRRGTLRLENLTALVLDEADEMLRMGFIDDVEWVLEQTPSTCQLALFSATMPDVIRKVARKHLKSPQEVRIASTTSTASTIRQRYWRVSGLHKLDALTRLLEHEDFDAMLVFVRTKTETVELAEKLAARGHACEPLNGDIPQNLRERVVERLKRGQLDIVVATDVVARGLDVERISHVVNYDIPHDTESYVHRIGRTGRAGRPGEAILFVAPREQRMLQAIERATRQPIEAMHMPTTRDVNERRVERFRQQIADTLGGQDLEFFQNLVAEYVKENDADPMNVAAALAHMAQGDTPLLLDESREMPRPAPERGPRKGRERSMDGGQRPPKRKREGGGGRGQAVDEGMQRFLVDVGHQHGLKPGNLVGAIANEGGLDNSHIGKIDISEDHATVDLPAQMPPALLNHLKKVWVCGQKLGLRPINDASPDRGAPRRFNAPRKAGPRRQARRS